ncbi:PEPxxWA-CTERM sorting domain-containing protein [Sphingomonas sp. RB3P16]|uniref:PEPxxWA-CTERM sorting domain-containing protein n=1 Tax=Parasphingomonas frigoris TaxID=3096163 RepID=UPI002FCB747A
MRGLKTWAAVGCLLATVTLAAPAQAVTIGFENGTTQGDVIQGQYESSGVTFSGATILRIPDYNFGDYPTHGGKAVVYNSDGDIRLFFSSLTFDVSAYATTATPLLMTAYGLDGVILGSSLLAPNIGSTSMIGYRGQGVSSVLFSSGAVGNFTLDDVSFGPAVSAAPEPASWAMMILGFGAIGAALRRRERRAPRVAV